MTTISLALVKSSRRALLLQSLAAGAVLLCGCASSPPEGPPPRGHLLIVGGGPIPPEILRRFVELAGGSGRARIVVFPMASSDPDAGTEITKEFRGLGATAERIPLDRPAAEGEDAVRRIASATGVWFGGGDQSLLTKALGGTRSERAVQELLMRGGVAGGTSAGAAVMSTPMITGDERRPGGDRPPKDPEDPLGAFTTIARNNVITTAGFNLLPGAIVDQHFVRRRRHNRLISLVLENPQLVGVGIDESTALEVGPDGVWRVLGSSVAVVYDARQGRVTPPGGAALGATKIWMSILPAGSRFDPKSGEATLPPPKG